MIRSLFSFLGAIFSLVTLGIFAAAFMLGALFHIYARDLPSHDQLAQYAPPTISRIYSAEGQLIDEFARERRLYAPISDIPDMVRYAFISAEDANFYTHAGYDPRAMMIALYQAIVSRGRNVRGASTITQQVMKNFLLSGDRTGERKIREIILAARVEQTLSKDQILELYLNEIFLGQNSYGVVAAAQTYFNRPLEELELHEVAFLAALPQAPSEYHPVRARERVTARRNWVLGQMLSNGYITQEEHDHAVAQPLRSVQGGDFEGFRASLPARDYFTDEIRRQLSGTFGEEEFFSGGLTIRATVEPDMQSAAAAALRNGLEEYDRAQGVWHGAVDRVEPEALGSEEGWRTALARASVPRDIEGWLPAVVLDTSGNAARIGIEGVEEVEAGHRIPAEDVTWARPRREDGSLGPRATRPSDLLAVGVVVRGRADRRPDGSFQRWSLRQIPEIQGAFMAMDVETGRVIAMQGGFSYQHSVFNRATQAMRQPGSAFKPFVFAAALDNGFTPATIVIDAPFEIESGGQIWRPTNATNRFYGPAPLRVAMEMSRNLMTVRLAHELGMETVAAYAERFRVYDRMQPLLANALGAQETTLFRMVAAYAMFANGGERVEPTLVDRVQDRWGRTIFRHDQRICADCDRAVLPPSQGPWITAQRERVMDEITAYQLTMMMQGVIQRGTATRIRLPVPVAGKTGTTNDARDVWFVGYTSNIVAGCYMGFDQPRPLGRGAGGGTMCAPVFNEFMRAAIERHGGTEFRVPSGGHFVTVDRYTGQPVSGGGSDAVREFFRDGEGPAMALSSVIDGGFAMGSNLPLFTRGETAAGDEPGVDTTLPGSAPAAGSFGTPARPGGSGSGSAPPRGDFGSMSSGGLY